MKDKTVMIVAIDATKKDGISLINALEDYPDGWLRAEWVARENYAPTVQLEKAETKIEELKKLSSHGNGEILLGWMEAHRKAMDRIKELETALAELLYDPYPSASAKASALDDTVKPE